MSPVSLTPEELERLERTRPKMPTLLGLGTAYEETAWDLTPPVPEVAVGTPQRTSSNAPARDAAPGGSTGSTEGPPPLPLDVPTPDWDESEDAPATQREPAEAEASRRERRIMRELFAVLDGLRPLQRQRLESQMSLEQLSCATPEALSTELDTPIERARELSAVVAAYGIDRQARTSDAERAFHLVEAVNELGRRSREFDDCDEEQGKEQRLARQRRRHALTRVNLLLAEGGELALLDALEPCAIAQRLERLQEWLSTGSSRRS